MIIISSRRDFNDPDHFCNEGHLIREIDLNTEKILKNNLKFSQLKEIIKNKKTLILVHGYNNEQFEVYDAYQIIENNIKQFIPDIYDYIIGYSWPGGDHEWEWISGKKRANGTARKFRFLIEELSNQVNSLDIMSHSLGARVVLKALKESQKENLVKNYYCTAPAVDNEVLEPNEEYYNSIMSCERLFVFHSSKDGVLLSYMFAERNVALGFNGPEDRNYISKKTKNIYVINCKKRANKHGDYKRINQLYKYIGKYQNIDPIKFKTI